VTRDIKVASRRWALVAGRGLLLLGAGLALVFVVASHLGEASSASGLVTGALAIGVIALLVVLGWRAPRHGGWLLVIVGLSLLAMNPTSAVMWTIAVPPMLLGALLIWGSVPVKSAPR
jgi:hypothetical protein